MNPAQLQKASSSSTFCPGVFRGTVLSRFRPVVASCAIFAAFGQFPVVAKADGECSAPLPPAVLTELANGYDCDSPSVRCIDAHVGRAFVGARLLKKLKRDYNSDAAGYVQASKFSLKGIPGTPIHIVTFATSKCALQLFADISFSNNSVKTQDSYNKPEDTGNAKAADAAASLTGKVQEKLKAAEKSAGGASPAEAIETAKQVISLLPTPPAVTSTLNELLNEAPNDREPGKATSQIKRARGIVDAFAAGLSTAKPEKAQPFSAKIGDETVRVKEYQVNVPAGDDNKYFIVETSSGKSEDNGGKKEDVTREAPWPTNVAFVEVDHGRYYWDFGVLFAGVSNGASTFNTSSATSGSSSTSSRSTSWAFQSMLTGTVYPFGREKFKPVPTCPLRWLGIQAGINSDVTKIQNAVSLGLVIEPVGGLAIAGGAMFYSRATAAAASDGTQATEHVFLPYVGLSLGSEFYNSLKSTGQQGQSKSN